MFHAGLATHYIASNLLPEVERALIDLGPKAHDVQIIGEMLADYQQKHPIPQGPLNGDLRKRIETVFGNKQSLGEIYDACAASNEQEFLDLMKK